MKCHQSSFLAALTVDSHPQSKLLPVIKLEFLQKPGGLTRFPYSVLLALCSPYSIDTTLNKTVPSHAKSEKTETWSDSWDKHRWTRWTCRLGSQSGIGHLGDKNCRLEWQVRGRGSTILQDPESKCDLETVAHFLSWPGQHGSYPKIITVCKTMSNLIYTYII